MAYENLFIAIFEDEVDEDTSRHLEALGATYKVSPRAMLVASTLPKADLLSDVLKIGDDVDPPRVGVVFKLNGSYSGFYPKTLWSWLEEARGVASG